MQTILIVEDDKAIQNNVEIFLSSMGFNTLTADNGLEALKVIEKQIPDLIISDLMMPYVDGIELLKRIQTNYSNQYIPFIFLTAKNDIQTMRNALSIGADDYIPKPFDFNDLYKSINARLAKKSMILNGFNELKHSLSKNLPHELRTPLIAILGFSEMILDNLEEIEKDELKRFIGMIQTSGKRLHKKIEKFLTLSSLELSNFEKKSNRKQIIHSLQFDSIVLKGFLNHIICEYGRESHLNYDFEDAELPIYEEHILSLCAELLENAFKFSPQQSQVSISGRKVEESYIIEVKDSGRGMSNEEIKEISSFKQFKRDSYEQAGLGLGLAIVKNIVALYDGIIIIESIPNQKTCVKISFPLKKNILINKRKK